MKAWGEKKKICLVLPKRAKKGAKSKTTIIIMQLQGLPAGNRNRVFWITIDQTSAPLLSYRSRCRQRGREFSIYINEMVMPVKYP